MEEVEVWFMVNGTVTKRIYTGYVFNAQIFEDGRGSVLFDRSRSEQVGVLVTDCIYIERRKAPSTD